MFNNTDPKTNGEEDFFNSIKDNVKIVFDVGCRSDSIFLDFIGEVHYFEPVENFLKSIKELSNKNTKSYFNNFGLGNKNTELYYYPKYQSFYNRIKSCGINALEKTLLQIKRGKDYMDNNNIDYIDFLKIDTEGYELNVLKGFGENLRKVKIIQFEYGGTFLDSGVCLLDIIIYLQNKGFNRFYYLTASKLYEIIDYKDHYQYCNIVCLK